MNIKEARELVGKEILVKVLAVDNPSVQEVIIIKIAEDKGLIKLKNEGGSTLWIEANQVEIFSKDIKDWEQIAKERSSSAFYDYLYKDYYPSNPIV